MSFRAEESFDDFDDYIYHMAGGDLEQASDTGEEYEDLSEKSSTDDQEDSDYRADSPRSTYGYTLPDASRSDERIAACSERPSSRNSADFETGFNEILQSPSSKPNTYAEDIDMQEAAVAPDNQQPSTMLDRPDQDMEFSEETKISPSQSASSNRTATLVPSTTSFDPGNQIPFFDSHYAAQPHGGRSSPKSLQMATDVGIDASDLGLLESKTKKPLASQCTTDEAAVTNSASHRIHNPPSNTQADARVENASGDPPKMPIPPFSSSRFHFQTKTPPVTLPKISTSFDPSMWKGGFNFEPTPSTEAPQPPTPTVKHYPREDGPTPATMDAGGNAHEESAEQGKAAANQAAPEYILEIMTSSLHSKYNRRRTARCCPFGAHASSDETRRIQELLSSLACINAKCTAYSSRLRALQKKIERL